MVIDGGEAKTEGRGGPLSSLSFVCLIWLLAMTLSSWFILINGKGSPPINQSSWWRKALNRILRFMSDSSFTLTTCYLPVFLLFSCFLSLLALPLLQWRILKQSDGREEFATKTWSVSKGKGGKEEVSWGEGRACCCSFCIIGSVVKCERSTRSFITGEQWLSVWQEEGWGLRAHERA